MNPDIAVLSDAGGRESNQDCADYVVREERVCCVLADGLGGHGGGDVASSIAVRSVLQDFQGAPEFSGESLTAVLERANASVVEAQDGDAGWMAMRTTVAVLWIEQARALWGHAGDTRLYQFRDGLVVRQTKDHSVSQVLVTAGEIGPEEIRFHEDRSRLLKSLGTRGSLSAAVESEPADIRPGDAFLLATDGFWELIEEREMEQQLESAAANARTWLQGMARVVQSRVTRNSDNYSAIAVIVRGGE